MLTVLMARVICVCLFYLVRLPVTRSLSSTEMNPLMEFSISAFGALAGTLIGALALSGAKPSAFQLALFSLLAAGMMSGCSLVIRAVCSTPGPGQAGRPDFGGLVLGCTDADFCK